MSKHISEEYIVRKAGNRSELLAILSSAAAARNYDVLQTVLKILKRKKTSSRQVYEALLQTYLFAGFPSALLSLKVLGKVYNSVLKKTESFSKDTFIRRGAANAERVYGSKFNKLVLNVSSFSPELAEWLVMEGYGKVLGRPGLSFKNRQICIVAMLTTMKYEDQLYSHLNGAMRSGITEHQLRNIISLCEICGGKSTSGFGNRVLNRLLSAKSRSAQSSGFNNSL